MEKCKICNFFTGSRKASFLSRKPPNIVYRPNLPKKKKIKQYEIFDQNHGLTPLEKRNCCDFFKSKFLWSKKASFLYRTSPNTFSWRNVPKRKGKKIQIFDENHGLTTFKKCKF